MYTSGCLNSGERDLDLMLPVPTVDKICLATGLVPWILGLAGGLPISRRVKCFQTFPAAGVVVTGLPVRAAGAVVVVASMQLRYWAVSTMVRCKTTQAHAEEVGALVTEGPFAWSRNPMYCGMVGSLGALGLVTNSWWGVIGAALPFAAYLNFHVIPREEALLAQKFQSYNEYARKTPRWILV